MTSESQQRDWYQRYYAKTGKARNDLRTNRGTLFQTLASEASLVRASYHMTLDPAAARVLDVGCGGGGGWYQLVRMGFKPSRLAGIDIQGDRLNQGRDLYPQAAFIQGDAARMSFPDGAFELVIESTLFATLPADAVRRAIASEMLRVCRPGGFLLLVDWRLPRPFNPDYKALTSKELRSLFQVGRQTRLVGTYPGALAPPIGRFLSRWAPSLYFLTAGLCPCLVGQVSYLLRKPEWRDPA